MNTAKIIAKIITPFLIKTSEVNITVEAAYLIRTGGFAIPMDCKDVKKEAWRQARLTENRHCVRAQLKTWKAFSLLSKTTQDKLVEACANNM